MLTVAVRKPLAEGSKVIWKVVLLDGLMLVEGCVFTLKSAACVPVMFTSGLPESDKLPAPTFSMVNVRTIVPDSASTEPKSVWLVVLGMVLL